MKTAAIYTRVSCDQQKENKTIGSQVEALLSFADQKGYVVPEEYIFKDEGYSGAVLVRPGLEKVRDLSAEGQIQAILIFSPDRLSRNYAYQVLLLDEFAACGTEVLFINSPKAETPEEALLLQFQGMIAEYERATIKERSRRGKRFKAKAGIVNVLCGAPYGYNYIRKTQETSAYYKINEEHAAVVKEIYRLYTEDFLSIGEIVREKGGYTAKNHCKKQKPREQWIEIPVPSIITAEIYELAQERLKNNKLHSSRNTVEITLLQGMLICSECGYALCRREAHTSKRKLYYYRCLGSNNRDGRGRKCHCRPIRQDYLDDLVWQKIIELLHDPTLIQREIDKRIQETKKLNPLIDRKVLLEKQKSKLLDAMDKLLDAYQEGLIPIEQLRKRMPELQKRVNTTQKELENLYTHELALDNRLQLLDVHTFTNLLHQNINQLEIIDKRKILKLLVKEIFVGADSIEIKHSISLKETENVTHQKSWQLCTRSK